MYVNIWLIDVEIKLERKYVWFTMIQTTLMQQLQIDIPSCFWLLLISLYLLQ